MTAAVPGLRRLLPWTLAIAVTVALVTPPAPAEGATGENPFDGATLFVDPASHAAWEAAADPANAEVWNRIARRPQADWFGDWNPTSEVARTVADRVAQAHAAGALPVFVVYAIPQRDCGLHSAGGMATPDAYRAWLDRFATGLGTAQAAIVLEPDALAGLDCLDGAGQQARLALLRWAVDRLRAQPGAAVYLDAGNSAWIPAATMAQRLADAGIVGARGFALNVSNYRSTADEVAYGNAVSERLGGTRFVVDTSRNGLGPSTDPADTEPWCNPPGRALGIAPTARTGHDRVDAYLWIKRPGESDGTCKGGPPAGVWWREYAFGLASRATTTDLPAAGEPTGEPTTATPHAPCDAPTTATTVFVDVPVANVHRPAIGCAAAWGLVRGVDAQHFAPGRSVTRAQMASFVSRLLERVGVPVEAVRGTPFTDIAGNPHADAITALAGLGLVAGDGDGRYRPELPVTRGQMATMLVRAYEHATGEVLPTGGTSFTDIAGSAHRVNIAKAATAGFTAGVGGSRYAPAEPVRRDQTASLLLRVHGEALP